MIYNEYCYEKTTKTNKNYFYAVVAQLDERHTTNVEDVSSNLTYRDISATVAQLGEHSAFNRRATRSIRVRGIIEFSVYVWI